MSLRINCEQTGGEQGVELAVFGQQVLGDDLIREELEKLADADLFAIETAGQLTGAPHQIGVQLTVARAVGIRRLLENCLFVAEVLIDFGQQRGDQAAYFGLRTVVQDRLHQCVGVVEQAAVLGVDQRVARFIRPPPDELHEVRARRLPGEAGFCWQALGFDAVASGVLGAIERLVGAINPRLPSVVGLADGK